MQRAVRPRRCACCGAPNYLPAWRDPRWCYHCAILGGPWRTVVFGFVRKVPPHIAQRWESDELARAA